MDSLSLKETELVCKNFLIEKVPLASFVFMVISHENNINNELIPVNCKRFTPFNGYCLSYNKKIFPITPHVYDSVKDNYVFKGVDYLFLGTMPFSLKLTVKGYSSNWNQFIPFPEEIFSNYLSSDKRKTWEKYKDDYSSPEFFFEYVQFLSAD